MGDKKKSKTQNLILNLVVLCVAIYFVRPVGFFGIALLREWVLLSFEQPEIYGYVFRAVLYTLAMAYLGSVILSKQFRETQRGWLVAWVILAAWSLACAIGVVSISGFLAPFLITILALLALFTGGC